MTPSDDLIRRLRECDADLAHEAATRLAELEAQVAKRHPNIVPGMMRCAKCNFVLIRSTLYVANGTVGAAGAAAEAVWAAARAAEAAAGAARAAVYARLFIFLLDQIEAEIGATGAPA